MGKMQSNFVSLLSCVGSVVHKTLPFPKAESVAGSILKPEIERIYHVLGGGLSSIPLNLRSWDIEFNGIAIELDEHLHFNRYRGATLMSSGYACLPGFPLESYGRYCSECEDKCLQAGGYGGKWSNASSEVQFGEASSSKNFSGNGSPRWKQRAFYDFVKDLSPLLIGVTVVRISIWDTVLEHGHTRQVGDVLNSPCDVSSEALAVLIQQRLPTESP
jgi:hypothetical protein